MKYHTFIVSNLIKKNSEELHKAFKDYTIYSARISSGFAHRVPSAMVTLVGDFDPKDIEKAGLKNSAGGLLSVQFLTTQTRHEPNENPNNALNKSAPSPIIKRLSSL